MILDKEVEVRVNGNMVKYYTECGYECKSNDIIIIDIKYLKRNSPMKINASCDLCQKESYVKYQNYNNQFDKGGFYCCHDCSIIKNKKTRLEKYGDENFNNREKSIKTCSEKYGVTHYAMTEEYRIKFEETCLERYGFTNSTRSEAIKEKMCVTNLNKYGVKYPQQLDDSKIKAKNTCLEKYGVDNPSKLDKFKEKAKSTNLERYGVESPNQNPEHYFRRKFYSRYKHEFYDIYYDSSFEKHFLDYCKSIGFEKIRRGPSIRYSNNRVYYPDFYIEELNLILEIKSQYIFNLDIEKNLDKKIAVINKGYDFLFIIDKKYDDFLSTINEKLTLTENTHNNG
jgi:hypothetical protein